MAQHFLDLDDTTQLEVIYDRILGNHSAQIWRPDDGPIPTDVVGGIFEELPHVDDLMARIPGLLERNGVRALTDAEYCELVLFATRSKDPELLPEGFDPGEPPR